ncbi:hypothetical protein CVIRNUC_000989 [Coccomyxa viridis]|uniref:3'-5' exonuclease n=1 Tax=Coccomyxa viridis TaxID=1274662 RepID=A0AAV1HUR1_9CHLO|nr:hypothetical protein CVIRNUC_000989 [Coccomyxa viridis]
MLMATEESRHDSKATAPAATSSKRKLPGSFSAQIGKPGQQAALQPLRLPAGCIAYAALQEEVENSCQSLLASGVPCLGFDIEWHVTYRTGEIPRPVALIQLASWLGPAAVRCHLLHIACSGITPSLSRILCSADVKKAGVGISGDAQKLMRDFGLQCAGLVDLSEEANLRMCSASSDTMPEKWSLARLAEAVLKVRIEKIQSVRTGNWEMWPLDAAQQQYAALDAYASLLLYKHLMAMPKPLREPPVLTAAAPDQAGGQDCQPLHISGLSTQGSLQPAKLSVWKLFMEQGMSIEAVAEVRHLKVDTVESYLAEAITAGRAYDWHRMRISDSVYAAVSQHASAQLRAAEEPKEADGFTGTSESSLQQQDRGLQQESVLQQSMANGDEGAGAEGVHQQEAVLPQSQAVSSDGNWEVCCAQPSQPSDAEKENCLQAADALQLERLVAQHSQ